MRRNCTTIWARTDSAHRRLFLPFADDDRTTSVILSKVLLLSEDEKITDTSILRQLEALRQNGSP